MVKRISNPVSARSGDDPDPGPHVGAAKASERGTIWIIPHIDVGQRARRHTPDEEATESIRSLRARGLGIGGSGILLPIIVTRPKVPPHWRGSSEMGHIAEIAVVNDGWERVVEARRAGVPDDVIARAFKDRDDTFPERAETIEILNKVRRHESAGSRCMQVALDMRRTQVRMTQSEVAKHHRVNERHLRRALKVVDHGPIELVQAAIDEKIELKDAEKCAELDATPANKAAVVADALKATDPTRALAKAVEKFKQNLGRRRAVDQNVVAGLHDFIYADVPWPQSHALPYETMTIEDITNLHLNPDGEASRDAAHPSVSDIAATNAILAFWTTEEFKHLAEGIMQTWGFEPLSPWLIWHKRPGMDGQVAQMCAEYLIIGRRGIAVEPAYKPPQIIRPADFAEDFGECEPLENSQKPELFRKLLQKMYPELTKPIELFARRSLPKGWRGWGNQYPGEPALGARTISPMSQATKTRKRTRGRQHIGHETKRG